MRVRARDIPWAILLAGYATLACIAGVLSLLAPSLQPIFPFAAAIVALVYGWYFITSARDRALSPREHSAEFRYCPACSYDLKGIADHAVCPECEVPLELFYRSSRTEPHPVLKAPQPITTMADVPTSSRVIIALLAIGGLFALVLAGMHSRVMFLVMALTVAVVFSIPTAILVVSARLRVRNAHSQASVISHCPHCAYDLSTFGKLQWCPECGVQLLRYFDAAKELFDLESEPLGRNAP